MRVQPVGAGTAYSSGAPEFIPASYWDSNFSIFSFLCIVLVIVVCPFPLAILLSVLLITRFGIFNSSYCL
jgi:hypothetical protein